MAAAVDQHPVNCRGFTAAWSRRTTSNLVPAASGRARDALDWTFRMALNVPGKRSSTAATRRLRPVYWPST
jgi:hypothetical protein